VQEGGGEGVPSGGRNKGAEASMRMDWPLWCVRDEDKTCGEMDEDWMGSQTRTGQLVWQKRRCRARRGPIGPGERGEDGQSGGS
jgi:hypothetical protein